MSSLKSRGSKLAASPEQLKILNHETKNLENLARFSEKLKDAHLFPYKPSQIEILQINVGKMCNQTCAHCHVDAGPDRKEIMTRETMQMCLQALRGTGIRTVDLTGGAPEMNPHFRWFVEELSLLKLEIIVRCNLTIILANKSYNDLPEFFKKHKVHVVSSLPYFEAKRTDKQRGNGVFGKSIEVLKMLNAVGYGVEGSGLILDLVYNPAGAFLPGPQQGLEVDFKREMKLRFGIDFNHLFAITNMPISRFLEYLIQSDNLEDYMERLVNSFNPVAAVSTMCRNTISVGWDGWLYDCDFNQMLDMKLKVPSSEHISTFNIEKLREREIIVDQHCFGCTAGAGSSCGGEVT